MATRSRLATLATIGAVLLASGGAIAATPRPGPAGDGFYIPPSPLPSAPHGRVIWARELTTSAALPSAARNILVLYHSQTQDGRDVAVSGAIAIPPGTPPAAGWPVITWAHGTTGIAAACAPSRDTPDGPEHYFLGMKQRLLDGFVKRGYAVLATDYQGLGPPDALHPFLQGIDAGRSVLDIVTAAREIAPSIGDRYVAMGHSQGGHAELFAAALAPAYAPGLHLLGNVAFAPASHIADTLRSMVAGDRPSLRLGYSMYVLQSFASDHPGIDLARILSAPALDHLPETRRACITATVTQGYWATAIPQAQFTGNADLSAVMAIAAENDPARLHIASPTFVAQGTADDTVLPQWTDETVRGLCANGAPVLYSTYPGATHETVVDQAATRAGAWIDARFDGEAASSNCAALPRAGAQ